MIAIACTFITNKTPYDVIVSEHYESRIEKLRSSGITGYLSCNKNALFQYLEGPENAVNDLISDIETNAHTSAMHILKLGNIESRRFNSFQLLSVSESHLPDIRIQDLIEDVMVSSSSAVFDEVESRRILIDMVDQLSGRRESHASTDLMDSTANDQTAPPYIVVLGASAGGMAPLQSIVKMLKPELNAAFIVVQHFSPKTETVMDMILQRDTELNVHTAKNGEMIKAGNIYVIPPGNNLGVEKGAITLQEQSRLGRGPQFPLDICFRSVAREYGDRAIAVVLSGTGSDGSRGCKIVHESGGVVLSQSVESSEFDGMPQSTIDTGIVHQILAPIDIAEFLNSLGSDYLLSVSMPRPDDRMRYISTVVDIIESDEIDFSQYKDETLFRRIERRRVICGISSTEQYIKHLQDDELERANLRDDILITVTSFFRDPDAWEKLGRSIERQIEKDLKSGDTYRVWVTACATGQEVYTLAMLLVELLENQPKNINFKIYATDIERKALAFASSGVYAERAMDSVSEERIARFFTKKSEGFTISREIRENVIFAPHNFIKNTPFTRMHLVTCRNVLIYMQPDLQQLAIKMLHFALNVNGMLLLGPSETLGSLQSEFYPIHREWNLFKKLRNLRLPLHLSAQRLREGPKLVTDHSELAQRKPAANDNQLVEWSLDAMAQSTGNTNILVDESRSVLTVISDPGGLLQVSQGEPTLDIVKMVPEALRSTLSFALSRAFKEHTRVVQRRIACVPSGQLQKLIDIEIVPSTQDNSMLNALVILSIVQQDQSVSSQATSETGLEADGLRDELIETKNALRAAINDLESRDDEQNSVNEQLSAANEELQSTNEELQSVNEELYTVNFEYQTKIHELSDLNQDLDNLLNSTKLGVIFLDSDLRIRRYTDVATNTVNILPSDVGRPFSDLAQSLHYADLNQDMKRVLSTGTSISRDIGQDGSLLNIGIHPYKAGGGLAQGVLLMFRYGAVVTIDQVKALELDSSD